MPRKSRSGRSSYETKRTSMRGNENFFAKGLTNALFCGKLIKSSGVMPRSRICADVAELADALDSGSSESNFMWVQVPSSAPKGIGLFQCLFSFAFDVKCAEMHEICTGQRESVVKHCVSRMIKMHGISGFAYFLGRYARMKTPRVNRKVNSKNWPERVFHRERGFLIFFRMLINRFC